MPDEEKFRTQCGCCAYHAPPPMFDYPVGDQKVCPTTYVNFQQLMKTHEDAGKLVKKNERGYKPFVRDLARAEFARVHGTAVVEGDDETASTSASA